METMFLTMSTVSEILQFFFITTCLIVQSHIFAFCLLERLDFELLWTLEVHVKSLL
jgi:hypothetical protein